MDYTIIDAHAHLWLRQDTVVDGFPYFRERTLPVYGGDSADGSSFYD